MTELERAYKTRGDELDERNALILQELPQVYYVAARIRERLPQHVELEDLVNAGVLGLIEACAKYDGSRNAGFSTFAKFRIRGAILDSLRSLDWGSRTLRRRGRAISASASKLTGTLGRLPLQEEIAADLNVTLEDFHQTLTEIDGLSLVSQKAQSPDDASESFDLIESAESRGDDNPFDLCLESEMREHLVEALRSLSEREQMILALYYQEELTMREIAEVLDVGTSRVSQILSATLVKLRAGLQHLRHASSGVAPNSRAEPIYVRSHP